MIPAKVILAHDLGTTGNKACLYDQEGHLICSHYIRYPTFYPQPTWVEQRPDDWWQAFVKSTKEVLSAAGVSSSQVLGLSFSGQMMSGIPVDREGMVLQKNIMIWADYRSQPQAEIIKRKVGWQFFYHITGAGQEIPLYAIAKILWLKDNCPEIYKRTYKFLCPKDVLILRLTGRFVTDYSDASNTGLLDIHQMEWARDMVQEVGIDMDKLCDEIAPSCTVVGKVGKRAAEETSLQEGTPVILGGGDVACAALGAGVINEGSAYNCIGSTSWLAVASSKPLFDDKMRPYTLCHVSPDRYVVQLATLSAGVAFEWFRDQICWIESSYSQHMGLDPYDLMTQEAKDSTPGCNGLIFLPNMRPGGAPHNNLSDRGALVALNLSHKRSDILRAVIEGITFNIRLLCEAMEKQLGVPFPEIRMIGGASKSLLWRAIEASILNRRIVTLSANQEANALGAAIVAGTALEIFESTEKGVEKCVRPQQIVLPEEEIVRIYERQFSVFNKAYDALVEVNSDIAHLYEPQ